jgi:hypothetical protein
MPEVDRTVAELAASVGPWKRSKLYRIGVAVKAAGAAETEDAAQKLIWALGDRATVRQALEHAGADVRAVVDCLRAIDRDFQQAQDAFEVAQLREAGRAA